MFDEPALTNKTCKIAYYSKIVVAKVFVTDVSLPYVGDIYRLKDITIYVFYNRLSS